MSDFISDQSFEGLDFTIKSLPKGEYEHCVFKRCNFSNSYLDNQNFLECSFLECNLSNTNIAHTQFNGVLFNHCKMLGINFEEATSFLMGFTFENCVLHLSSFSGLSLKKTHFLDCKLIEVDFTKSDLTQSLFEQCDLDRAIFVNSILEKVDFSSAYNFIIDPELNRTKNAVFTLKQLPQLLTKHQLQIKN